LGGAAAWVIDAGYKTSSEQNLSSEEAAKVIQAFIDKYHNEHPDLGWPSKEWLNGELKKAGYRITMLSDLPLLRQQKPT
jgi:hypothetical protein